MEESIMRKWFEKQLKNYDDPFWCYHSDLRNMFNNILAKNRETQGGKY